MRLGGAVETESERIGGALRVRFWNALLTRHFDSAREAMGAAEAARAWTTGRAMPFDEAIEQALRAGADVTP